jgi:Family of unknown function (DUF6011)
MNRVYAPHDSQYRPPRWATQPQIDRIKRTLAAHDLYFGGHYDRLWKILEAHEIDVRTPGDGTRMTRDTASATIDWLDQQVAKLAPAASATDAAAPKQIVATPGVYRKDGTVYVVKPNKAKTRVYASKLVESPPRLTESGVTVDFELEYAKGVIYELGEADRLALEDAREYLTRYGRCIYCKHPLKAAKSVEAGVGPVCRKMYA